MAERIYPLTFEPVFRDYVWGGRNLERLFGRRLPPGIVAESWEISGHPTASTLVADGYWGGTPLPQVLAALGVDLVGSRSHDMLLRHKFPLLVKLLDAQSDLSVQVHPDDAYALIHEGGELGKTEMWYVLHAEPGAELIYGLKAGVTPTSFGAAIAEGRLSSQLHRVAVHKGDCIFVPAGTVHALLAGLVVAEVQQNSDTTYRVYDWGRLGSDGRARPLHIAQALQVINWDLVEPQLTRPQALEAPEGVHRALLVKCDKFTAEEIELEAGASFKSRCDGSTFEIWGTVSGEAAVEWCGTSFAAPAITFVLLPAALGDYAFCAHRPSRLLRFYVE